MAEACALVGHLQVSELGQSDVKQALESVADVALHYGICASLVLPDCVLLDISGTAHLFGGEKNLAQELGQVIGGMGHRSQLAIANGPRLAMALARFRSVGEAVIVGSQAKEELRSLPLAALALPDDLERWFARLGVLSVAGFVKLPRESTAARLGPWAASTFSFCDGYDDEPLTPYRPKIEVLESANWEEGASGNEPLLFVLRGLSARVSARLEGRGQAAHCLELIVEHDAATARFAGIEKESHLKVELASPLWRRDDIYRVLKTRLQKSKFEALSVGLKLKAAPLVEALSRQLDFSQVGGGMTQTLGEENLPVLFAELSAELGAGGLGGFELCG